METDIFDELLSKITTALKPYPSIKKLYEDKLPIFLDFCRKKNQPEKFVENPLVLLLLEPEGYKVNLVKLNRYFKLYIQANDKNSIDKDINAQDNNFNFKMHDFNSEALACEVLKNNGFKNIEKLKIEGGKTPDFKADYIDDNYLVEVKTLNSLEDIYEFLEPKLDAYSYIFLQDTCYKSEIEQEKYFGNEIRNVHIFLEEESKKVVEKILDNCKSSKNENPIKMSYNIKDNCSLEILISKSDKYSLRFDYKPPKNCKLESLTEKYYKWITLLNKINNSIGDALKQLSEYEKSETNSCKKIVFIRWRVPYYYSRFDSDIYELVDNYLNLLNTNLKKDNLKIIFHPNFKESSQNLSNIHPNYIEG